MVGLTVFRGGVGVVGRLGRLKNLERLGNLGKGSLTKLLKLSILRPSLSQKKVHRVVEFQQ